MLLSKSLIVVTALTAQALGNPVLEPYIFNSAKSATKVVRSHPRDFARGIESGRVPMLQRDDPNESHSTGSFGFPPGPQPTNLARGILPDPEVITNLKCKLFPETCPQARAVQQPGNLARSNGPSVPTPDPGPVITLLCRIAPDRCPRSNVAVRQPSDSGEGGNANGNVPNLPSPGPLAQPRSHVKAGSNKPPGCPTSDCTDGGPAFRKRDGPAPSHSPEPSTATRPTGPRDLAERNKLPMCDGGEECEPVIDRRQGPNGSHSTLPNGFVPRPRPGARDLAEIPEGGYIPLLERDAPYQTHDTHPSTFPSRPNTGNE